VRGEGPRDDPTGIEVVLNAAEDDVDDALSDRWKGRGPFWVFTDCTSHRQKSECIHSKGT
jgi:hypothetical protein